MLEDGLRSSRACAKVLAFGSLCFGILLLGSLAGCNRSSEDIDTIYANLEDQGNWSQFEQTDAVPPTASQPDHVQQFQQTGFGQTSEPRVATLMPVGEIDFAEIKQKYWAFPAENEQPDVKSLQLTRLPEVPLLDTDSPEFEASLPTPNFTSSGQFVEDPLTDDNTSAFQRGPRLSLPENIADAPEKAADAEFDSLTVDSEEMARDVSKGTAEVSELLPDINEVASEPNSSLPEASEEESDSSETVEAGKSSEEALSRSVIWSLNENESEPPSISAEEERLLRAVIRDASHAATGALSNTQLNEQAKTKIREAYSLANRRAHYAARQELIEVVRMISQAKDAQRGVAQGSLALAAGLRALDEAEDFAPKGTQLEAELNLEVLTAAHRTPIANQLNLEKMLPQEMMTLYYRYAQLKLALAVAGEPAGSMALHTLGKIQGQLWKLEPGRHRLARRRAIAYQQAALLAHPDNYLASHELGVLLAGSGYLAEAERLLLGVASQHPHPTVFRNLAKVQEDLGKTQQASANRTRAQQQAQPSVAGRPQVQWISPDAFARIGDPHPASESLAKNVPARQPNQSRPPQPQRPSQSYPNWR